ncbi:hypothetical protein N7463_005066 [Penicillium fimorum]|uniref:Uncharacterized protein n=1 Tax=Penicillium fimorum TaxID=1882269 RepID=A0A9X0C4W9_9EURO|nr:hypothetical protein N7463_005066 [Penicillium fimorum]
MSSSKQVTARESSERMLPDRRSLLNKLLVATRNFVNRKIDEKQLESTADEIEKHLSAKYPTLAISSLFVKDVEKILGLKWTHKDTELASIHSIQSPPVLESGWKYGPVKWRHKKYFLSGRPDYGVWYGEDEELSLNVVVVEAKREEGPIGRAQALAYVGCVHRQHKELKKKKKKKKKKDCTIYGIASDGCACLAHLTQVTCVNTYWWCDYSMTTRDGNYDEVLGVLVHMFTKAAVMSHAHSNQPSRMQEGSGESAMTRLSVHEDVEMTG